MSLMWYIVLAFILFAIGGVTVVVRKSTIIQLMGVEMMLNSANLVFIAFSRIHGTMSGQVMAFFVMVVAAAEVVIGLALIVAIFKSRANTDVDDIVTLKH
ncbi:NADH-quinone oxidoreductase subunit NuoK [Actinomycetaceae bacterium WB03_NA08]|uniref:NADH-quinone oxidoreductase subunit K n=1 Tax=Scrofimicrobium canadense TaxID=2652290 RepID=A0A6N7W4A2_9ACTO|nr:NADH-quinone oxidoreductase subunit NuoK [Scrofimicrobium canadense]MSS83343.1 NADH-quinone oxidoreductase subunit NuoK [Scrofimicrobium canadense]